MSTIPAGVFKAKCLEIMDEIDRSKEEVIVTKYGRPVVRIVPAEGEKIPPLFGRAKGSVSYVADDAFSPEAELWSVLSDE